MDQGKSCRGSGFDNYGVSHPDRNASEIKFQSELNQAWIVRRGWETKL
jgi:hypothetical protein